MPPASPWLLRMAWRDLCFLHWPVEAAALQRHLPQGLEVETFGGQAYLGVVPLHMSDVAPRFTPSVPRLSFFPELNLRTYVRRGGETGVWFFTLDAAQPLAVALARTLYHLPYQRARMHSGRTPDQVTRFASVRTHAGSRPGEFAAAYRPVGPTFETRPGTLDDWLTNRMTLYSADRAGRLYAGPVAHAPWRFRRAEVDVRVNTIADWVGVELTGEPLALHAEHTDVRAHGLRRLT